MGAAGGTKPPPCAALNRAIPLQQLQPLQRVQPLRWVRPFAPQPAPFLCITPSPPHRICPSALHLSLRAAFIRPHPSPDHLKPQRRQGTSGYGERDGVEGVAEGLRLLPFGALPHIPPCSVTGASHWSCRARGNRGHAREGAAAFIFFHPNPPAAERTGWGGGDEETHSDLQRRCCHPSRSVRFIIIYSFFWSVILASRLVSWRSRVINIGILVSGESPPADTSAPGPPPPPAPRRPTAGPCWPQQICLAAFPWLPPQDGVGNRLQIMFCGQAAAR